MNISISKIRRFAALAGILGMTACGGYTTVDLGGTVTGLTTDGLVLVNGGDTVAIPANATSYKFPAQIGTHAAYDIQVKTQPARLTCTIINGKGNTSGTAITAANVSCTPNLYSLGGTVNGLTAGELVLNNGSDIVHVPATGTATTFVFPNKVADGTVYGVAVLAQPAGLTCTVTNGTAVMGAGDVTNVQVNCL